MCLCYYFFIITNVMNCEQYPIKKIVYLCLFDLVTLVVSFDTPLNSLKDSNASPKIKTTKEE